MKALLLAACLAASTVVAHAQDAKFIETAKQVIADTLKDPASAQFRKLSISTVSGYPLLCGEINAKNSYGGYVGFRRFYSGDASQIRGIEPEDGENRVFDILYPSRCY